MRFLLLSLGALNLVLGYEKNVYEQYNSTSSSSCVCTTVPCPEDGANYLDEGGGSIGTYYYAPNANGIEVVRSAKVTITKANLDQGTGTTKCTQDYSRTLDDDGVEDCDAGHILAHSLGGPGNQPINIFPQDPHINRGAWAQYEGDIHDCLSSGSVESASLSWKFNYDKETDTKPISASYSIDYAGGSQKDPDCVDKSETFTNDGR